VQKVGRHFELFEKNLTEPDKQHPKKNFEQNYKLDRAQYKPHVGLNLLDVFFKVLIDLFGQKTGDQIRDANGPDLQKSDGVRKILTEPLNQGFEKHRNVT
jgi:hypothetical protein